MSKVVCEVSCWRFSLDDASRSGRPAEVDNDQIKTLIENNQHYTTWETADMLKISKSIKVLVKRENVLFYFTEKTVWTFWPTRYVVEHLRLPLSSSQELNMRFPSLQMHFSTLPSILLDCRNSCPTPVTLTVPFSSRVESESSKA